jgi:hypothetical protein
MRLANSCLIPKMKKIILGNIELIIDNNNLFVMRKRLIKIDNNWEIEKPK